MALALNNKVLAETFGPSEGMSRTLKQVMLLVIGVAALWISAKIQIATVPVPVTLQLLVIMSIGAAYGSALGLSTVAAYVALGVQGLPVFAGTPEKGIGLAYIMGPTGGYILGFMLAAYVVGMLAKSGWDRSPVSMAGAMAVGILCVYIPGVIWLCSGANLLAGLAGQDAFMGFGWQNWYAYGVKTFIWVDALKLVAAVIAFPMIWRLVGDARQ
ncbi:biotin transporter BioY [Yoonia sp. BS5-3]|uniref:Biotin transporter n=1 Tax=Yoonia phaeophyticola TaxID=3137369 RepID=A0ABZ2V2X5_9RHOB